MSSSHDDNASIQHLVTPVKRQIDACASVKVSQLCVLYVDFILSDGCRGRQQTQTG